MARLKLIGSPLVGAGAWTAVAQVRLDTDVVDYGGVRGPDWYDGAARRIVDQVSGAPWIAVLHSGAGGLAPAIAERDQALVGLIFVDAVLPYPGASWMETAPPTLASHLRSVAADGLLPPWNEWFGADPLPRLIPEDAARARFVADLPRVPIAFLQAPSPATMAWERLPSAFVRLSEAYEAEAVAALARGWPVERIDAHHLAMITDPQCVAALLTRAAGSLGLV